MTPAACRRRAAQLDFARLATVRPDGAPHLVPITFALLAAGGGGQVVTAVDHKPKRTTELQRLVNLRHEPRCAVLFDHTDSDWARLWWVRADGVATVTDDPTPGHPGVAALVDRYEIYADRQPAGPLVVVEVNTWSGWAADATVSPVGR